MRSQRRRLASVLGACACLGACFPGFVMAVLPISTPSSVTVRLSTRRGSHAPLPNLTYVTVGVGCGTTGGSRRLWMIERPSRTYPDNERPLDVTLGVRPDSTWRMSGIMPVPLPTGCYAIGAGTTDANGRADFAVTADGRIERR